MATIVNPSYRNRLGYQAMLLGGICCLVSIVLISGNKATHQLIADHITADKLAMLDQVLPSHLYDNDPLQDSKTVEVNDLADPVEIMVATKTEGKETHSAGTALQLAIQGWGGTIDFIMAVDGQGEITGVRVISHKETPGLADKIERDKSDWIESFNGKSLANTPASNWAVKKDGGIFDQFTGATITPRSMVKGVYQGLQIHQQQVEAQKAQQKSKPTSKQNTQTTAATNSDINREKESS